MNRKPNSAFAVIDYGKTVGVCMDIYCPCGQQVHFDAVEGKSAQHIRCPWCKDVLRVGADVNLLTTKEDFSIDHGPSVFIQWKGSDINMQGNCTCGEKFDILGWFQYECQCPACQTQYHCESHLTLTKLSAEEAALVDHVNDVDKDLEDMTDAERDEYEARMQAQWEKEHTCTYPPLRPRQPVSGLLIGHSHVGCQCNSKRDAVSQPVELGYLADPGHAMLSYSNLLGKAGLGAGAEVVLLGGDYMDGVGAQLPDLSGRRVLIMPDVHVPVGALRLQHGVRHDSGASELADLFAVSRWPGSGSGKAKLGGNGNNALKPGGNRQQRRKNRRGK